MLAQLRRIQKWLLIVVTSIIVVSFAFLYSDFDFIRGTVGSQDCIVRVNGRCYRLKETQKLATNFDVAIRLGLYDFAISLFREERQDRDPTDFILSLIVLRAEAEKMGIEPSAEEIKEAIPNLPVFTQRRMSPEQVENTILGPSGFTDGDFAQLVKDYLCWQRLRDLVGSGIQAVPVEVEKNYIADNQRFHAWRFDFDRGEYAEKVEISEKEIADYYEENKDSLLSEEKRGFEFIHFVPTDLAEDATNEEKAKHRMAFANEVNRVYSDLTAEGADFEKVLAAHRGEDSPLGEKTELGVYDPFPRTEPPEGIAEDGAMLEGLFSGAIQPGKITEPFGQEDGSYYVFRYSEGVAPEVLSLEDATPGITTALKNRKSDQMASEAANAARGAMQEALGEGKSIAEAAAAAGVEAEELPVFSGSEPPSGIADPGLLVGAVEGIAPGEFSPVRAKPEGRGHFLVYVDRIELYKDEDREQSERSIESLAENRIKRTLFTAWLNQRRAASGAEREGAAAAPVQELAPGQGS